MAAPTPTGQFWIPTPLESEPESDEEDRTDGIFSPQFVQSTGVHVYMKMCREHNVVPVQQFISMLDHEVVSLKHRGVGRGGKAIFECLRHNKHIQALDMEDNQLGLNVNVEAGALRAHLGRDPRQPGPHQPRPKLQQFCGPRLRGARRGARVQRPDPRAVIARQQHGRHWRKGVARQLKREEQAK